MRIVFETSQVYCSRISILIAFRPIGYLILCPGCEKRILKRKRSGRPVDPYIEALNSLVADRQVNTSKYNLLNLAQLI